MTVRYCPLLSGRPSSIIIPFRTNCLSQEPWANYPANFWFRRENCKFRHPRGEIFDTTADDPCLATYRPRSPAPTCRVDHSNLFFARWPGVVLQRASSGSDL
ncbi:hypothetical protein BaRGS_00039542 [Batillaria attramentaria]|uniref:Uncharacterized protein n=1 Tax=Batillaria attramentaria TaxID=370345 RepID=A0ABD0J2X2_9CAEN